MSKKQTLILTIVFILTFFTFVISATFAWFAGFDISLETADNDVSSATTETLVYNAGGPISIFANSMNFGKDMGSLKGSTSCFASLTVGSNKEMVTFNYDVKLVIDTNNFIYTQGDDTPELLLVVTDPLGNPVQEIKNLKYVNAGEYQGFDITKATGEYDIALNYPLQTTSYTSHEWKVEVIFINYDEDQNLNKGKSLIGRIEIGTSGELT